MTMLHTTVALCKVKKKENEKIICDEIKQNESEVKKYEFGFLLGYCLGFNLVKTPQRLGNWF